MSTVTERSSTVPGRRGLGLLLTATGVSVTGDGVLLAASPLMAAALSRDPLAVASVSAAGYGAWLLLGLPAGALVDRWDRRRVMVLADLGRALVLLGFIALVLTNLASIAALAVVVFLVGVGSCFFDPAAQSLIPVLVGRDKERLARANGRLWSVDTFGRSLAGPPLGAAAFAAARALPFSIDAASFLVSAGLVARLPASDRPADTIHAPILSAIKDGVAFLFRHAELRRVTLGMATYNFGYNVAFATLVLYAQDSLNVGTIGFGLLVASMAIGGIAGGWLAPRLTKKLSPGTAYAASLITQALVWISVVLVGNPWVAGISLAVLGVASVTSSVVGGSTRQLHSPDELLGRVVSTTRLLGIGSAALGALAGGLLADVWGLAAPFWAASALLAVGSFAFMTAGRSTRR
jgi:MFS family permease